MYSFRTFKRVSQLMLLAGLLVVVLAACNREKSTPTAQPTVEPPTVATAAPAAAPLAGAWQGKLVVAGTGLEIVVNLAETDGQWSGTIDIPAQGATGIPLHDLAVNGDAVSFAMLEGAQQATFTGQMQAEGGIAGTFEQSGYEGTFELARPQEEAAAAPLPYAQEPITFTNGDVTLAGTLTLPAGDGPFPALLLITGSGQQNRDEAIPTVPGYKPFAEIADVLTRRGIAVLRYDDRGVGESTGDPTAATSADFADDAEAGFVYLQGRADIDAKQVGLLGHSEGGLIAAMIAARNPEVAFVVSMAGTAIPGSEVIAQQAERLTLAGGGTAEEAAAAAVQQKQVLDLALAEDWTALQTLLTEALQQQVADLPQAQQDAIGDLDAAVQQQVEAQMQIFRSPWYQFFLKHDPATDWAQVGVPVLGLYGGKDTQVDATANTEALQTALDAAGNLDMTIQVLPTANHLFQEAKTGGVDEYPTLDPHLMAEFLNALSQWLTAHLR